MHPHPKNFMETNSNTPEAKQPASAGCHPTPCSPVFSDAIETRRLWDRYLAGDIITTRDLFDFARKMEHERDKIHAALVKLDGIYRHDLNHPAHRPDWLRDALSLENDKDLARRVLDSE